VTAMDHRPLPKFGMTLDEFVPLLTKDDRVPALTDKRIIAA
jgi:hypothetical protein